MTDVAEKVELKVVAIEPGIFGLERRWPAGYKRTTAGVPFVLDHPGQFSWKWMEAIGWDPKTTPGVPPTPEAKANQAKKRNPNMSPDAAAAAARVGVDSPYGKPQTSDPNEPIALSQLGKDKPVVPGGGVDPNQAPGGADPGSAEAELADAVGDPAEPDQAEETAPPAPPKPPAKPKASKPKASKPKGNTKK